MSIRMNSTLFSEVNRLEKGDFITFHCELLSQLERDVQRYFFGAYYPRWHALYLDEVRDVIGNLGYTTQRHFPVYPFDVYLREDGEHFQSEDLYVGRIISLPGLPSANLRDDEQRKMYKVIYVDDSMLRTRAGVGLPTIHNSCRVPLQGAPALGESRTSNKAADCRNDRVFTLSTCQGPNAAGSSFSAAQQDCFTSTGRRVDIDDAVGPATRTLPDAVVVLLTELRDAYIKHTGGGIPELGIKAMGRPFRRVSTDGRRWMTLDGFKELVKGARGRFADISAEDTAHLAQMLHRAFLDLKDEEADHWESVRSIHDEQLLQCGHRGSTFLVEPSGATAGQSTFRRLLMSGARHSTPGLAYLSTAVCTPAAQCEAAHHRNSYNDGAVVRSKALRVVGKRPSEFSGPFFAVETATAAVQNRRSQLATRVSSSLGLLGSCADFTTKLKEASIPYAYEPSNNSTARICGTFHSATERVIGLPVGRPTDEEDCGANAVDYDVFINFVRGPMSEQRKCAVKEVFSKMDHRRNGHISLQEVSARLRTKGHPTVVDGTFDHDKQAKGFLSIWDGSCPKGAATRRNTDIHDLYRVPYNAVAFPEFLDYYNGVSAVIEEDSVFLEVLRRTWNV